MSGFLPPLPPVPSPPLAPAPEMPKPPAPLRIAAIMQVVADRYGVTPVDLIPRSRDLRRDEARLVAMAMCARCTRHNHEVIAAAFGRHRTTVLHAERTIARRAGLDDAFAAELAALEAAIRTGEEGRHVPA